MRVIILLSLAAILGGCASAPVALSPPREARALSDVEKAALTKILSQNLRDPGAVQFKWMPVVIAERGGITDYCGLVNGKNSDGAYMGFARFYAHLQKDEQGQFTNVTMRAIEDANRVRDLIDPRWRNGICEKYGYLDFSQAL